MNYGYQGTNGNPGYYAPTQQPSSASYGPVYYNVSHAAEIGSQHNLDTRKRAADAANNFLGEVRQRKFDAGSYGDFGPRLVQLQGLQLPELISPGGGLDEYVPHSSVGGQNGGGVYGPTASHGYALPPLPNLRTKNDLTAVESILEQMTATVYESSGSIAAAGVGQPDATYTRQMETTAAAWHHGNSPPSMQLPSSHQTGEAPSLMDMSNSQGPSNGTPALTPASTTSYSSRSSHSPASLSGNMGMSPGSTGARGAVYPMLPSTSTGPGINMLPTSTLGSLYDNDAQRRHSGGTLQKARPVHDFTDGMDMSEDHEQSMPQETKSKANAMPDPTFSTPETLARVGPVDMTSDSTEADRKKIQYLDESDADEIWVESIRLLEALSKLVRGKLERGEYELDGAGGAFEVKHGEGEGAGENGQGGNTAMETLYPVLRQVEA